MSANTQVNSDGKLVASLPVFKLLAISQDVLNPTEINYSREIDTNEAIRTVAGTMYDEYLKSGDSDTQQLLDTQNILDTVGVVYEKLRTQFLAARSAKNVMSQNYLSNKMKLYQVGIGDNREVYIEGVRSLFKRLHDNTDYKEMLEDLETQSEVNNTPISVEMEDKLANEYNPLEAISPDFRLFLSLTMYNKNIGGYIIQTPIDLDRVIGMLLKHFASREFETDDILSDLKTLSVVHPQLDAVYQRMLTESRINNSYLYQFKNIFNLDYVASVQALFNSETGRARVFAAMGDRIDQDIVDEWSANWYDLNIELATDDELQPYRVSLQKYKNMFANNIDDTNLDEDVSTFLNGDSSSRTMSWEKTTGMKLSPATIKFLLLHDLYTKGHNQNPSNPYVLFTKQENKDLHALHLKSISEEFNTRNIGKDTVLYNLDAKFFEELHKQFLFENKLETGGSVLEQKAIRYGLELNDVRNPYIDKKVVVDTETQTTKAKEDEGMRGRMRHIAIANSVLDDSYISKSYVDASGNTRYAYVKKSYLSTFFRRLKDNVRDLNSDFMKSLLNSNSSLLTQNIILRNSQANNTFYLGEQFRPFYISDVRQGQLPDERNTGVEEGEGVTSRNIDNKTRDISWLVYFNNPVSKRTTNVEGETVTSRENLYSYYFLKTNEVKNTDLATLLPLRSPKFNKWSDTKNSEVKDEFYRLFLQDFLNIQQERRRFRELFKRTNEMFNENYNPERMLELAKKQVALELENKKL